MLSEKYSLDSSPRILEEYHSRLESLENSNQDLRNAFKELTLLHDLARIITSTHDIQTIMDYLVKLVAEHLEYKWCALLIWDYSNRRFDIGAVANESREMHRAIERHDSEKILTWAMEKSQPTFLPFDNEKSGSFILAPLHGSSKPIGVLHIATPLDVSRFSGQHFEMLNLLAGQTAVAIENALLWQQMNGFAQYLTSIINGLQRGVIVLDQGGIVSVLNPLAREILMLPEILTEKVHYTDIFPKSVWDWLNPMIANVLLGEKVEDYEVEYERSDGVKIPINVSINLLRNPNMEINGIILIIRDLRETRELIKLRHLDQIKSSLLSTVSHELRTPLTSIKAYSETLLETINDRDQEVEKEFLSIISDEADRLSRLIDDLLSLSRIEKGAFVLNRSMVEMDSLLRKVAGNFENQIDKHRIIMQITENLPPVNADLDKIHQVIANILGNAIKYSPEGGDIIIEANAEGEGLCIRVSDQGIGIDKENHDRVFENFFRVNSELTRKIGGTGLGLSISKYIIEAHGGRIGLDSELGKGSTFWFRLPFSKNNTAVISDK